MAVPRSDRPSHIVVFKDAQRAQVALADLLDVEPLEQGKRVTDADVARAEKHATRSEILRGRRDFRGSLREAEAACAILPGDPIKAYTRAVALKQVGRLPDAVELLERAFVTINSGEGEPSSKASAYIGFALAGYYQLNGQPDRAQRLFGMYKARVDAGSRAWFHATAGDRDAALREARAAVAAGSPHWQEFFEVDVEFDRYRNDPEFKALFENGSC